VKILIATLLKRTPDGRPFYSPASMNSIYNLSFQGQIDYIAPSGVDSNDAVEAVATKYEQVRQWMLAGNYDALFCVESDMLVPPDALQKLDELGVDIAYGLYCWRHGPHRWNAYTSLEVDKGLSLCESPTQAKQLWGQVVEVAGLGLGCTLIRRHVLEVVPFRHRTHMHCDWLFAMDAAYAGAQQVAHLSVICGHIGGSQVYYPDPATETLYRVETL
jgi:hypothetical protein